MLCYVMLRYVMLCHVMLCDVMLCYVMLCYVMLYCIVINISIKVGSIVQNYIVAYPYSACTFINVLHCTVRYFVVYVQNMMKCV